MLPLSSERHKKENVVIFFSFRVIIGLTQFTNKAHIARATLEATCFQTREVWGGLNK